MLDTEIILIKCTLTITLPCVQEVVTPFYIVSYYIKGSLLGHIVYVIHRGSDSTIPIVSENLIMP